jgi:hypothetical protein
MYIAPGGFRLVRTKAAAAGQRPENYVLGRAIESYGYGTGKVKTKEASTVLIVGETSSRVNPLRTTPWLAQSPGYRSHR